MTQYARTFAYTRKEAMGKQVLSVNDVPLPNPPDNNDPEKYPKGYWTLVSENIIQDTIQDMLVSICTWSH